MYQVFLVYKYVQECMLILGNKYKFSLKVHVSYGITMYKSQKPVT